MTFHARPNLDLCVNPVYLDMVYPIVFIHDGSVSMDRQHKHTKEDGDRTGEIRPAPRGAISAAHAPRYEPRSQEEARKEKGSCNQENQVEGSATPGEDAGHPTRNQGSGRHGHGP